MTSLHRSIAWRVVGGTLAVFLPIVLVASVLTLNGVREENDARLALLARALESTMSIGAVLPAPSTVTGVLPIEVSAQYLKGDVRTLLQFWTEPSRLKATTENGRDWAFDAAPIGFSNVQRPEGTWRVYTGIANEGGFARVAALTRSQGRSLGVVILEDVAPLLAVLSLLGIYIDWRVRRGLAPLSQVAERVDRVSIGTGAPIDVHEVPAEAASLVRALNGLVRRAHMALELERRFAAYTTSELRTPVTALNLSIQSAAGSDEGERAAGLSTARLCLDRMDEAIKQIEVLSIADQNVFSRRKTFVEMQRCVIDEVAHLSAICEALGITVQVFTPDAAPVHGWEWGLRLAVRKILQNAIRITPNGGVIRIDVRVDDPHSLAITVGGSDPNDGEQNVGALAVGPTDELPIMGSAEMDMILVQRVADLHNGALGYSGPPGGQGFRVILEIPVR